VKKQLVIIGITLVLLAVGLTGCIDDNSKIVGTWTAVNTVPSDFLTIFSDGTIVKSDGSSGTWELKDGKVVMVVTEQGQTITSVYDYTFSNNDNTMTFTNTVGHIFTFTKS
jgi:outer membrane lipoprotein SlyB